MTGLAVLAQTARAVVYSAITISNDSMTVTDTASGSGSATGSAAPFSLTIVYMSNGPTFEIFLQNFHGYWDSVEI